MVRRMKKRLRYLNPEDKKKIKAVLKRKRRLNLAIDSEKDGFKGTQHQSTLDQATMNSYNSATKVIKTPFEQSRDMRTFFS